MKRSNRLALVDKAPLATPTPPQSNNEKLQAAIDWLGRKWRLHPDHDPKALRVNVLLEWRAGRRKPAPLTVREGA